MIQGILVVSGIGLAAGVLLVIASKFMFVPVDETAEKVRACLPGANCGACGFAGCDGYADALAKRDGTVKPNLCTPGGEAAAKGICEVLGLPFEGVKAAKSMIRCSGDFDTSVYVMDYEGPKTCRACNAFYQGRRSCSYGCLGYGDCVEVCKFGALSIQNGLAVVNRDLCTGCGACAKVCPNHLFEMIPDSSAVWVGCASHDKGAFVRKVCKAGCIGCMKCQKTCEYGAITVTGNLAHIDPEKCTNCGACVEVCPVHVIHKV